MIVNAQLRENANRISNNCSESESPGLSQTSMEASFSRLRVGCGRAAVEAHTYSLGGRVFRESRLNFSSVHGNLPETIRRKIPLGAGNRILWPPELSHWCFTRAVNGFPAVHQTFRYLEKGDVRGSAEELISLRVPPGQKIALALSMRDQAGACDRHDPGFLSAFKNGATNVHTEARR